MAERRRNRIETARYSSYEDGMYIHGNTVRRAEAVPNPGRERQHPQQRPHKKQGRQVQHNRTKALSMDFAYVRFLTVAAIIALIACVWYLQIRADLAERTRHVAELQTELSEIKEDNSVRYNTIMDSINLEMVREKAVNEMGMVCADSDQVVIYKNPSKDYVKQYQDIPGKGLKGKNENIEK